MAEVCRHLARQRSQCRLRCRVGRACEGVHATAGDGCYVDDGTLGRLQFLDETARERDRGKKIYAKNASPVVHVRLQCVETLAIGPLDGDSGIIDQCLQRRAVEHLAQTRDAVVQRLGVAEVDL